MDSTPTRQRALDAALELFSRQGYHGTSMGDVAGALGIKAPSLYKHFKGKEELYASLFPLLEQHYTALWAGVQSGQEKLEHELRVVGLLSLQRLEQETLAWLTAELDSAQAAQLRRLMALGQFQGDGHPDHWLWTEPLALYQGFFGRLIAQEVLRRGDPHVMAVEYLAPLVQLLAQADRQTATREDCLEEARRHIGQFHRVFAHREQKTAPSPVSRLFRR